MMTIIIRRTAALALASAPALLAGCVSFGPKVPDVLLSLTPRAAVPAGAMATGRDAGALVVLDPEVDRRLDVQRVPVQVSDSAVAYLKDAMWVERPARQFRRLLAETLRARGSRLVLEAGEAEAIGNDALSGRLLDMGYDARSQSVVVRYDALRRNAQGVIAGRRFEAVVPGVSPKAEAVGPALNKAANDIAAQVAEWVG